MIHRLLQFIATREPVAATTGLAAVIIATLGVAAAFGANITETQIAAIGTLAAAIAGWLGRSAVTPILGNRTEIGTWTEQPSDPRGSIPVAMIIVLGLVLFIIAGIAVSCDAMFEDEDEVNDLGAPALILDHDDWGGGSDGNAGGEYEGGRGGSDYDGDGDGNRCRNFCFYGVPYPGQPQPYLSQAIPSLSASSRVL